MASRDPRACRATQGDFYVCPLPAVPRAEGELDNALAAVWSGAQALRPVVRERHDGQPERMAAGYDDEVPMRLEVAGVRSGRQAQASERARRARVASAMAAVEALTQGGRGKKRFEEVSALRQAVGTMVQRPGVEAFVWLRSRPHTTPRVVRASRGRPTRLEADRQATVEVRVDAVALEAAGRRLGGRV